MAIILNSVNEYIYTRALALLETWCMALSYDTNEARLACRTQPWTVHGYVTTDLVCTCRSKTSILLLNIRKNNFWQLFFLKVAAFYCAMVTQKFHNKYCLNGPTP